MNKGGDFAFGDGFLDLGRAEHHFACLIGKGKAAEGGVSQEAADLIGKPRRHLGLRLQGPGKDVALGGFCHEATVGGDPYAAAGKPLFQVWDNLAARSEDEADQVLL